MTIQWRTAYDHYGDAQVAAGEAVTLELTIMLPHGDGWSVAPLQGRTFVQRVISADGSALIETEGVIVADEGEANFLRFEITGADTAGLLSTDSNRVELRHEIAEVVTAGRDVLHCGDFVVERMGAAILDGQGLSLIHI